MWLFYENNSFRDRRISVDKVAAFVKRYYFALNFIYIILLLISSNQLRIYPYSGLQFSKTFFKTFNIISQNNNVINYYTFFKFILLFVENMQV